MKLYFHGLELDVHRTPDLSRAPDGAGMFEIRGVEIDDAYEWDEWVDDPEWDRNTLLPYLKEHCRSVIEAACEAEAGL